MLIKCPNCASIDVGKIGTEQFYCWNCFIEMTFLDNKVTIHQVESDGSLSSLDDLFTDEERKAYW